MHSGTMQPFLSKPLREAKYLLWGNVKHDPTDTGLEEPDTNSTQAKPNN